MDSIDDMNLNTDNVDMDVIEQLKEERPEYSEESIIKLYKLVDKYTLDEVMVEDVLALLDSPDTNYK